MVKLTRGQKVVLTLASVPMAATGIAGGIASFFNFRNILDGQAAAALSIVAAGEGATLVAALVMLALTLLGQHTPAPARFALWALPALASVAGGILAPTLNMKVVMVAAPLAMTVSGEGVTLVARRIVAFQTGTDIEQQRRSGLLLWHANRAANGTGLGRRRSQAAVWRLTKQFAATDTQMSVQLSEVQRFRIGEGADVNLAAVLSGKPAAPVTAPNKPAVSPSEPLVALDPAPAPLLNPEVLSEAPKLRENGDGTATYVAHTTAPTYQDDPSGFEFISSVLAEAERGEDTDPNLRLVTVAEAAELRGVEKSTVRSWKARGKLNAWDTVDGSPLFRVCDVMAVKVPQRSE